MVLEENSRCLCAAGDENFTIGDISALFVFLANDGVRGTVARARGEVGPTRGITVIAAPGAAAAAVMPGVLSTPGLPRGGD